MSIIQTQADYDRAMAAGFEPREAIPSLSGFAEACYNGNSLNEVIDCRGADPDETDMEKWGIEADEWRGGQVDAIEHSMFEFALMNDLID